jgi:hypothetical protein
MLKKENISGRLIGQHASKFHPIRNGLDVCYLSHYKEEPKIIWFLLLDLSADVWWQ